MRTALYAGIIGGFLLPLSVFAVAAEGSALRGLKPPHETIDSGVESGVGASAAGLKWRAVDSLPLAPRLALYGGTFETRRFSVSDIDVRTSIYRPSVAGVPLSATDPNPLHDLLPRYSLYRHVSQSLPGGWGLGFGVRQSEYNFATLNLYSVSAERYFGNFRGAYTLYSGRTESMDPGLAHRWQVNYFYGERNTIGLAYTTGRDFETLAAPFGGVPYSDVRDLTLSGRHWISTNWALTYDLLSSEQGNLYRRQGLRLGVSRSF